MNAPLDLDTEPSPAEPEPTAESVEPGTVFGDDMRQRLGPTAISIIVHACMLILLLLFSYGFEKKQGLSLFLKMGDAENEAGQALVVDSGIDERLELAAVDVTRLEKIEPEPTMSPDLPRMTLNDLKFERSEIARPAPATAIEGFGTSQFEGISETVRGVSVKIGDPQFTLIWDTDADLDLHVIEPGGAHIYWEFRDGKKGGELDVDDVDGLGPENVYWKKGAGPEGEYAWWVHYYGGSGGRIRKTNWKVRIKHDGQIEQFAGSLAKIDDKSPRRTFVKGTSPASIRNGQASKDDLQQRQNER